MYHPTTRVLTVPSTRIAILAINATQPPASDKRVRQAMHYALDVNGIIKNLYAGQGTRLRRARLANARRQRLAGAGQNAQYAQPLLTVGAWPRPPGKVRLTASIASLLTRGSRETAAGSPT